MVLVISLHAEELSINGTPIHVEIPHTKEQREQGLMFRTQLAHDSGMLFVFDQPGQWCFWSRNTPLSLSLAFIDDQGSIVKTDEMVAETDTRHCTARPARYGLEMEHNWFPAHNVKPGDTIKGLDQLRLERSSVR
ncbi:MAG: DUF192 domain-containing protein [Betaproteobacteria bacterium]|nr:DUF192 domain-containing protein [Betaproteobacteria bacterium]